MVITQIVKVFTGIVEHKKKDSHPVLKERQKINSTFENVEQAQWNSSSILYHKQN